MPGLLLRAAAATAAPLALSAALCASDQDPRPLPDARAFLEEVRQNLRSDGQLLEQYTFMETLTQRRLDSNGGVKKASVQVHEVYPSIEPGKMYRRLVARDGVPLSEKELAERDRKQQSKAERLERRKSEEDEAERARRMAKEEENRRKEKEVVDELFRMDDIAVAGRDSIDGRAAIIVAFSPRPGYRPATAGGKVLQKLAGRAWIDEEDRQLVRIEATLLDSLGVGPGGIARLQRGATSYFVRRKVNDEIWLPAEARFTGAAKMLLFFGARMDALVQYGDYRKFSVSTESAITADP